MSFEEKSAWIMGVAAAVAYATYVAVVLGMAGSLPVSKVPYVAPLLWTVGGSIVASVVLHALIWAYSARGAGIKDQRDKEINRSVAEIVAYRRGFQPW